MKIKTLLESIGNDLEKIRRERFLLEEKEYKNKKEFTEEDEERLYFIRKRYDDVKRMELELIKKEVLYSEVFFEDNGEKRWV